MKYHGCKNRQRYGINLYRKWHQLKHDWEREDPWNYVYHLYTSSLSLELKNRATMSNGIIFNQKYFSLLNCLFLLFVYSTCIRQSGGLTNYWKNTPLSTEYNSNQNDVNIHVYIFCSLFNSRYNYMTATSFYKENKFRYSKWIKCRWTFHACFCPHFEAKLAKRHGSTIIILNFLQACWDR